jgi:hypothetical protein
LRSRPACRSAAGPAQTRGSRPRRQRRELVARWWAARRTRVISSSGVRQVIWAMPAR